MPNTANKCCHKFISVWCENNQSEKVHSMASVCVEGGINEDAKRYTVTLLFKLTASEMCVSQ